MNDTPTPSTPPARLNQVQPGEATAGTLVAGLAGYLTAVVAAKAHVPTELVTAVFGVFSAGAMAIWHRFA
jgi:hypothetical protein